MDSEFDRDHAMNYGAISFTDAVVMDQVFDQFKKQVVRVLEIGVWKGDTARGMRDACARNSCGIDYWGVDAQRHADPDPPFLGAKYFVIPSEEAWRHVSGPFDVVFVDGCHCLSHVITDAVIYGTMIRPNGFILFHDTAPHLQGVQTNHWVHGSEDRPEHRTHVVQALMMLGWIYPNRTWKLWKEDYDPKSDIGGITVFQRTAS